jgi:hypothetical protein
MTAMSGGTEKSFRSIVYSLCFPQPCPAPAAGSEAAALFSAGRPRELTPVPAYAVIVRAVQIVEEVSCALFKR